MTVLSPIAQAWKDRGCDIEDVFVRHAIAAGHMPPAPAAAIERRDIATLCPIVPDVPFPGPVLPLPADHDRRSLVDVRGWSAGSRYPFDLMAVGDSFVIHPSLNLPALRSAAHTFGKANGVVLKLRRGRCWRLR